MILSWTSDRKSSILAKNVAKRLDFQEIRYVRIGVGVKKAYPQIMLATSLNDVFRS